MPTLDVNGLKVHYQQLGRGPDLVMVHGLLSSLAFWYLSVAPLLASDYRVTLYDLRGHGLTDMPSQGYTTLDLARDLDGLLESLGIRRAHLAGHSFGGAVILQYALLRPERVRSLIEADAAIMALQRRVLPRGSLRWRRTAARLRERGYELPDRVPRVAHAFLEDLVQATEDQGDSSAAGLRWDPNSAAHRRWRQLMQRTSAPRELRRSAGLSRTRIRRIRQPTLAIFGEHSNCLPTLRALERNLRNCRRVIVPGSGHMFPVRRPQAFSSAVRRFTNGTAV